MWFNSYCSICVWWNINYTYTAAVVLYQNRIKHCLTFFVKTVSTLQTSVWTLEQLADIWGPLLKLTDKKKTSYDGLVFFSFSTSLPSVAYVPLAADVYLLSQHPKRQRTGSRLMSIHVISTPAESPWHLSLSGAPGQTCNLWTLTCFFLRLKKST